MIYVRILVGCALAGAIIACTPIKIELTPEGQQVVEVDTLPMVDGCEELGTVAAASSSAISNVDTRALNARNHAGDLGGNRIIGGEINLTGEKQYRVFRCR